MSHLQPSPYKSLMLRHAWLNLWDKHMTTGRINQVSTKEERHPAHARHAKAILFPSLSRVQWLACANQSIQLQEAESIKTKLPNERLSKSEGRNEHDTSPKEKLNALKFMSAQLLTGNPYSRISRTPNCAYVAHANWHPWPTPQWTTKTDIPAWPFGSALQMSAGGARPPDKIL